MWNLPWFYKTPNKRGLRGYVSKKKRYFLHFYLRPLYLKGNEKSADLSPSQRDRSANFLLPLWKEAVVQKQSK